MASARAPREVSDVSNIPRGRQASTSRQTDGVPLAKLGDGEGGLERNTGASIKIKKMTRIYDGTTKFPKLEECAHFHYDVVDLGPIQVCFNDDDQENIYKSSNLDNNDHIFYLKVFSNEKTWTIRRTYENFRLFDKQLHRCIYDRRVSCLPELRKNEIKEDNILALKKLLKLYLNRFSSLAGNMINCGPVLSWIEMDNRGNHLIATDESAINTPAVAAAHVVRRYNKQAPDEISFDVGDIISIIDMPPQEETQWWRGKRGFEVGFFPSDCVEVIGDTVPQAMASKIPETPQKAVLRKRGKLISFLRQFFSNRPSRSSLKRTGIVKERVFGCDLGEHLLNSGHEVPLVLQCCTKVIETHGIVDGIYRLSGVASNIQKLRNEFDQDQVPDLTAEEYLQDIHSISSLLKMYFRELPNPLFTYQLYDKFSEAIQDDENKLMKIHDVVQQLPPPHYRTAENLIRHLARVAEHGRQTGMHFKNLAIVWAPNLLRSKELETSCNAAALQGVGVQAIVTEFLITYADLIFSDKMPNFSTGSQNGSPKRCRPKSLAISTPTKLLSLEEARNRALEERGASSPRQKFIEVGGGPSTIPAKYHTIIDLPYKKKHVRKSGRPKSPVMSGFRSLFTRGRMQSWKMKQQQTKVTGPTVASFRSTRADHALTEEDVAQRRKLRTVKSADSLLSVSMSQRNSSHLLELPDNGGVNPYAVSDVLKGRPSVTSTMSEFTPRPDDGRPPTQRSLSCDYTGTDSEMDADMSSTEEGVFFEARACKSDSDARIYSKSLTEEVTEYMNMHPIILGLGSQSESCEEVSLSSSMMHDSLHQGEMVPILTRSPSLGLYEDTYATHQPVMHTFGRPVSVEPPMGDSDSELEFTNHRRTLSEGPHSYPSHSNLPRSRAPLSPDHFGYLLETDIDSVITPPGGNQNAVSPDQQSAFSWAAPSERPPQEVSSPIYSNVQSSFFDDSPVKLLSPIGEILPLMQSPGSKRRYLPQSPEEQMVSSEAPEPQFDACVHSQEDVQTRMEVASDANETDESMPSGDELLETKTSSGYGRMDISGESNEGSLDGAMSPEPAVQHHGGVPLHLPPDLHKSQEEFDADMGSIGSFSELSKSLNSLLNDVGSRGSYASTDEDAKPRRSAPRTPSELLIPEAVSHGSLTTVSSQDSSERHTPAQRLTESPLTEKLDLVSEGGSSDESDVADHYGTKPVQSKSRPSQSESVLHMSPPHDLQARSFQGQMPVTTEASSCEPRDAMKRSYESPSGSVRSPDLMSQSLNPYAIEGATAIVDSYSHYQRPTSRETSSPQASEPQAQVLDKETVKSPTSPSSPPANGLTPDDPMSRSLSVSVTSEGVMSRSGGSDLVEDGSMSRSLEKPLSPGAPASSRSPTPLSPDDLRSRSAQRALTPSDPLSPTLGHAMSPDGFLSRSMDRSATPEDLMLRSYEQPPSDIMTASLYLDDPKSLDYLTSSYDGNLSLSEDGYSDRNDLELAGHSDEGDLTNTDLEESLELREEASTFLRGGDSPDGYLSPGQEERVPSCRLSGEERPVSPVGVRSSSPDPDARHINRAPIVDSSKASPPEEMSQSLDEEDLLRPLGRSRGSSTDPIDIPKGRIRCYSGGDALSPSRTTTADSVLNHSPYNMDMSSASTNDSLLSNDRDFSRYQTGALVECDGESPTDIAVRKEYEACLSRSADNKDTPAAKRKRSVKDLTSQFEEFSNSPPKDKEPQMKYKPVVFQKPKLVHLNTLSPTDTDNSSGGNDYSSGTFQKLGSGSKSPSVEQESQKHEPKSNGSSTGEPNVTDHAQTEETGSKVSQKSELDQSRETRSHEGDGKYINNSVMNGKSSVPGNRTKDKEIVEKSPPKDMGEISSPEEKVKNVRKLSAMWERRKSSCSESSDRSSAERMTRSLYESSQRSSKDRSVSPRAPSEGPPEVPPKSKTPEPNIPQTPKEIKESKNSVRQLSQMFERQTSEPPRRPVERTASDASRMTRTAAKAKMWTSMVE